MPPVIPADDALALLYLDLLKKCLTRELFDDHFRRIPWNTKTPLRHARSLAYTLIQKVLDPFHLALVHVSPRDGETMIGIGGLDNIQYCVTDVLQKGVPGDLVETGIWKGGSVIFMRAILKVYGDTERIIWAADSFEGLPKPDFGKYPADKGSQLWTLSLGVSLEEVKRNLMKYHMLDDQVLFLKGWFRDTIPTAPIERVAVLRLDGDMYESTIQVLESLYPKVSVGGYVIVDDYGCIPECDLAIQDFRAKYNITEEVIPIKDSGVFWQRLT